MPSTEELEVARERVKRLLAEGPEDRLISVVVGSIDARATIDGRVRGLSSPADQAHLFAWREVADIMLVGDTTLTVERYGSLLPDELQQARVDRSQAAIPRVATISRNGSLDVAQIRRAKQPPELIVYSEVEAPEGVDAEWVQHNPVTVTSVVDDLRARGSRVIVSEGGPTLFGLLFAAKRITDLSLTIAPMLVGDDGLRVVEGITDGPSLRLVSAEPVEGNVFVHYSV